MKISCHKSCKWPGNGKPLAAGSPHKSTLWNKISLHCHHTCSPSRTVLTFFFTRPMHRWVPLLLPRDSSLVKFSGCWARGGLEFAVGPFCLPGSTLPQRWSSHCPKTPFYSKPKFSCSPSGIQVPTPVSFVPEAYSPFKLNSCLFNTTGL